MTDQTSTFRKIINVRDWPLFRPIPEEYRPHVQRLLVHELFWNTRLALTSLLSAMALYYWLIAQEINISDQITTITLQASIALIALTYYFFGENLLRSPRTKIAVSALAACLVGGSFGVGFLLQVPQIHDIYRVASIFALIIGVTGAASFTFTVSAVTFLAFCLPFIGPVFYWLWASSPGASGQILVFMALPYFTSIFFLILREYRRRVNLIVAESRLKKEQERSELLLLNILPQEIAEELKAHGRATASEYDRVTVLFTDFVGFTRIAEKMAPRELIDELDRCFSYFDQVTEKYGLEKLKTIGPAPPHPCGARLSAHPVPGATASCAPAACRKPTRRMPSIVHLPPSKFRPS